MAAEVLIHRLLEYVNYHILISYCLFKIVRNFMSREFFFVRFEGTGRQNYQMNGRKATVIEQVVGSIEQVFSTIPMVPRQKTLEC
jgi:hypothetical protein